MTAKLPQPFRELENWLDWSLADEGQRYAKRAGSSLDDLRAFSAAMTPFMHDIIGHLSKIPWGMALSPEDENLYRMGLSYMEVVVPLDLGWKNTVAVDSFEVERLNLPERL